MGGWFFGGGVFWVGGVGGVLGFGVGGGGGRREISRGAQGGDGGWRRVFKWL